MSRWPSLKKRPSACRAVVAAVDSVLWFSAPIMIVAVEEWREEEGAWRRAGREERGTEKAKDGENNNSICRGQRRGGESHVWLISPQISYKPHFWLVFKGFDLLLTIEMTLM